MCKSPCGHTKKSVALLILRLFVGGTFVFHGLLKVMNMPDTVQFFSQIGFANPFWAYLVSYVEVIFGALVVLGLFSMYAVVPLMVVMIVVVFKIKFGLTELPFMQRYLASELDLSLLTGLIAIGLMGPGMFSIVGLCKCKCHKAGKDCGVCKTMGCKKGCGCGDKCKSGVCDSSHDHAHSSSHSHTETN